MEAQELDKLVTETLQHYLVANRLRSTTERTEIARMTYRFKGHFTLEELHGKLSEHKFNVSRATLYNTVEHLCRAGLLARHQFPLGTVYETTIGRNVHYHRICPQCGAVSEGESDILTVAISALLEKEKAENGALTYCYALCPQCRNKSKKRNIRKKKQNK